jgi:arylsulfatase
VDLATNVHIRRQGRGGDNRLENIGAATSNVSYGPGWAQAATAPSWLYKGVVTEGGTRAVAFLNGRRIGKAGSVQPAFTTVMDVAPTFLELAGLPAAAAEFEGRPVRPMRGRSWAALLSGEASRVYPAEQGVASQFTSGRAYRQGDWKITDIGDGWRLFDLAADPGETRDLSTKAPKRKAAMVKAYERYAEEVGVVMPDPPIVYP